MTTPKAIARSFTRYATAIPTQGFECCILRKSQAPINSAASAAGNRAVGALEELLVPMLIFADHVCRLWQHPTS